MADSYRDSNGRLLPGHPGIKPVGARSRLSKAAVETIGDNWDDIVRKLVEQAISGDVQAAKLLISLSVPKNLPVQIEDVSAAGLISEIQQGNLSAVEMRQVSATIGKIEELGELAEIRAAMVELKAILDGQ